MEEKRWMSFPFTFIEHSQEIDRLFDELIYRPWGVTTSRLWNPSVDVYETTEGVVVEVDVPGARKDDVGFEVSERDLVLWGERSCAHAGPQGTYYCQERIFGRFRRIIRLPDEIATEGIESEFTDGVLRIFLPKREHQEDDYE